MSTNENETVTGQENETVYFQVTNGVISLLADYRGDGEADYPASLGNGKKLPLPDVLVIPKQIGDDVVTSLASGMFYNNKRVKEIVLPEDITEIPESCFESATELRTVNGTNDITVIARGAFVYTRIKEARFPNLETLCAGAFAGCGYLKVADIGSVLDIPEKVFRNCALLHEVIWREDRVVAENKVSIGPGAFHNTWSLRDLPLLAHVNYVDNGAFCGSGISATLPAGGMISEKAFPTFDNETDFWTGVKYTPHCNRIITKFSQSNPKWANKLFLAEGSKYRDAYTYQKSCAIFAVMHIHSAITGKYYAEPDEFVQELNNNGLSQFLYYDNWPGQFHNVAPMFKAMGYRTEVHGTDSDLSREDYQDLVDALAQGAYIYAQIGTVGTWDADWDEGKPDWGHAVVIYGINDLGEVCVLDSDVKHEQYRDGGLEPGIDIYTHTIPYQNIAGPSSNFVIVYPTVEEPVFKCTGCADGNVLEVGCLNKPICNCSGTFVSNKKILSDTRPFELPAGINVSVVSTAYEWKKLPEAKEGYFTTYHLFSSPAQAREEWQPNGSINKYVRYATGTGKWSDWYVAVLTSYIPQENVE